MSVIKLITLSLLLCVTLSITAQATVPEAPFIYYYSHIYNGWIIERADGTDGYVFGVDVMSRESNRIDYYSWSPSGEWLMWVAGEAYTIEKQLHFAKVDGTSEYSLPVNIAYPSESILIWSPYGDYLMILQDRYQSQYTKILDIETGEYIFEIESEGVISTEWTANGVFVHDNQYVSTLETLELYEFTLHEDFELTTLLEEGETECLEYLHHISLSRQSIYYCQKFHFEELSYIRIEDVSGKSTQIAMPDPQYELIWSADGNYAYVADRNNHNVSNIQILSVDDATLKGFDGYGVQILKPAYDVTSSHILPDLWLKDTNYLLYQTADELCLNEMSHEEIICLPKVENGTDYALEYWSADFVYTYGEQYVAQYDFNNNTASAVYEFPEDYVYGVDITEDARYLAHSHNCGVYCVIDLTTNQMNPGVRHSAEHYHWGHTQDVAFLDGSPWLVITEDGSHGEGWYQHFRIQHADGSHYRELTHTNYAFGGVVPVHVPLDTTSLRETPIQKLPELQVFPESTEYRALTLSIDWSPDGSTIATINRMGKLRIYNANSGDILKENIPLAGNIEAFPGTYTKGMVFWHMDNERIYLHLPDYSVSVQENSGNFGTSHLDLDVVDFTTSQDRSTQAYAYINGQILVQRDEKNIYLDDILETNLQQYQRMIEVNQDGSMLASYMYDDGIVLWDTLNGERVLKIEEPELVAEMALRPDGQQLAYAVEIPGQLSKKIVIVDTLSGGVIAELSAIYFGHSIAYSPDSRLFLRSVDSYVDPIITFYDTETYEIIERYYGAAHDFAWSPDGSRFATASSTGFFIWETPGYDVNGDTQEN